MKVLIRKTFCLKDFWVPVGFFLANLFLMLITTPHPPLFLFYEDNYFDCKVRIRLVKCQRHDFENKNGLGAIYRLDLGQTRVAAYSVLELAVSFVHRSLPDALSRRARLAYS